MRLFKRQHPGTPSSSSSLLSTTTPRARNEPFDPSLYLLRDLSQASSDLSSPITLEWQGDDGEFEGDEGSLVHAHGYTLIMDERYFTQRRWPELYPFNVFVFKVAGITHHQKDANTHAFRAGELAVLEREPTNSYGTTAVKVLSADRKLLTGYIPHELSAYVAPLMDGLKHRRESGIVLKTYNVGQHRDGIEIVAAIGRELSLSDD